MTRPNAHVLTTIFTLTALGTAGAQRASTDTIVRRADRPVHPGVATLVEEMSIGVADGAEHYMLGEIADIAFGRDGSIYAFDRQVPIIRQYDAQGKFVRNIGRRGEGPGEYKSTSGLATLSDGRLLQWDTGNWRINVYSATGDVLPQLSTPSGTSGSSMASYARALMVDAGGRIVTRKMLFTREPGNRPTVWIRFRADGTVLDTIHPVDGPTTARVSATNGPATRSDNVPFAPRRFVVMSPLGYLVAGFPDRYAFEIHEPGKPVVSVRRDVNPEPVSRSERASERRRIEESMRETNPTWSWNGPDIPDTKPFYGDLQVGLDGRIWVAVIPEVSPRVGSISSGGGGAGPPTRSRPRVDGPPPIPPRPALYDVFEPDGRYLGQVQVPARVSSVARRGDQVWAIAIDEDDVPRIKRYRIAWKG